MKLLYVWQNIFNMYKNMQMRVFSVGHRDFAK